MATNDNRSNQNNDTSRSKEQQQQQNTDFENPQQGDEWNNYQTKELSSHGRSGSTAKEAAETFEKDDRR